MKIIKCNGTGNIMAVLTEKENVDEKIVKANDVDAAFEKHVPQFEVKENKVIVSVDHVMEDDHYIEWIMVDYGDKQIIKEFKPGDEPKLEVEYQDDLKAYSYCNKHSLWEAKL
jgi:superoxide reductase